MNNILLVVLLLLLLLREEAAARAAAASGGSAPPQSAKSAVAWGNPEGRAGPLAGIKVPELVYRFWNMYIGSGTCI